MKITFWILVTLLSTSLYAQDTSKTISKNIVFVEAFGVGGFGSLNYERVFPLRQQINLGVRLGLGTIHVRDFTRKFNPDIIVPLALNATYGNKHKVELGIGQTISNTVQADYETGDAIRNTKVSATGSIGYRFQPKTGFFFRVVYSPIFDNYQHFEHWGGLSLGYSF